MRPRSQGASTVPSALFRFRSWAVAAVGACGLSLSLLACEDTQTNVANGLLLPSPLTLDWNGKELGAPFDSRGTFQARANLRARWRFRLEAKPANPDDPRWHGQDGPPLFSTEFSSQDRILFTWRTTDVNPNRYPFARGDTCTARITLEPTLDPAEAPKAVFTFVIGG